MVEVPADGAEDRGLRAVRRLLLASAPTTSRSTRWPPSAATPRSPRSATRTTPACSGSSRASATAPGGALVAVCGELAADERAAALLVGLGVRELSVAPAAVPFVKQAVRCLDSDDARAVALRALAADGADSVALHPRRGRLTACADHSIRPCGPRPGVCCGRPASVGSPPREDAHRGPLRLRLLRGRQGPEGPARRQGREPRGDDPAGAPGPARLHGHHRGVPALPRARRGAGRAAGPGDRGVAAPRGRRGPPARALPTTRCW